MGTRESASAAGEALVKQCDMDKRSAAESREVGTSSQKPSRQFVSGGLVKICCLTPILPRHKK
jgi:hypothetical protein